MIVTRLSGGMGNQMFQYAAGRALADKHGVPLALDLTFLNHRVRFPHILRPHFIFRDYALDVFNIRADIAAPEDVSFWNRPFFGGWFMLGIDALLRMLAILPGWEKKFSFDARMLSLGPDAYLEGFWQSEKYFMSIAPILRSDFTLKEKPKGVWQAFADEISATESVCIHVRRTDMALKNFQGVTDVEYYRRGLAYVKEHAQIAKVYVFSDDIEWCKKNITLDYPVIFVGNEYAGKKGEGHLVLMSACKHFVISRSTFSWWAAWLGMHANKIVVAPAQWFAKARLNTTDLIPETWVRI